MPGGAARRALASQRRNTMSLDANDRFIVSVVTRGGIAEDLNDHLERPEFRPDDDRLTDLVCRAYAEALGELDDHDPGCEEAYGALLDRLLARLGIRR